MWRRVTLTAANGLQSGKTVFPHTKPWIWLTYTHNAKRPTERRTCFLSHKSTNTIHIHRWPTERRTSFLTQKREHESHTRTTQMAHREENQLPHTKAWTRVTYTHNTDGLQSGEPASSHKSVNTSHIHAQHRWPTERRTSFLTQKREHKSHTRTTQMAYRAENQLPHTKAWTRVTYTHNTDGLQSGEPASSHKSVNTSHIHAQHRWPTERRTSFLTQKREHKSHARTTQMAYRAENQLPHTKAWTRVTCTHNTDGLKSGEPASSHKSVNTSHIHAQHRWPTERRTSFLTQKREH